MDFFSTFIIKQEESLFIREREKQKESKEYFDESYLFEILRKENYEVSRNKENSFWIVSNSENKKINFAWGFNATENLSYNENAPKALVESKEQWVYFEIQYIENEEIYKVWYSNKKEEILKSASENSGKTYTVKQLSNDSNIVDNKNYRETCEKIVETIINALNNSAYGEK